jgi:ech hydrogenase subunit A
MAGYKNKKILAVVLAAIQTPLMVWFELSTGHGITVVNNLYVDRLSMIMVLIIGIIGTLICVYGIGYMKDFQKHHQEAGDRRPWFFFLMFLFLSAMFGIVVSNNLVWLYFFWEITTLCSFFLIGYNGLFYKKHEDKVATRNAFRALIMNLVGGLGFVIGIIILVHITAPWNFPQCSRSDQWDTVLQLRLISLPLREYKGRTDAFQQLASGSYGGTRHPHPHFFTHQQWSKAGVFPYNQTCSVMGWNVAGIMVMMVGGITFLMASFNAILKAMRKKCWRILRWPIWDL